MVRVSPEGNISIRVSHLLMPRKFILGTLRLSCRPSLRFGLEPELIASMILYPHAQPERQPWYSRGIFLQFAST